MNKETIEKGIEILLSIGYEFNGKKHLKNYKYSQKSLKSDNPNIVLLNHLLNQDNPINTYHYEQLKQEKDEFRNKYRKMKEEVIYLEKEIELLRNEKNYQILKLQKKLSESKILDHNNKSKRLDDTKKRSLINIDDVDDDSD